MSTPALKINSRARDLCAAGVAAMRGSTRLRRASCGQYSAPAPALISESVNATQPETHSRDTEPRAAEIAAARGQARLCRAACELCPTPALASVFEPTNMAAVKNHSR